MSGISSIIGTKDAMGTEKANAWRWKNESAVVASSDAMRR